MDYTKKIAILTTGGTISSVSSSHGIKPVEGVIRLILEKLGYNGELISSDGKTKIEILPTLNKDSTNINNMDQAKIATAAFDATVNFDGVIITHGTDSMQFTSSMLSLMLLYLKKPVILTGSMKTIEQENSDAATNLEDAITFARSGIGGVFVVFHGKVFPGQWVYETTKNDKLKITSSMGTIADIYNKKLRYHVPFNNQIIFLNPILETRYNSNIGTVVLSPNDSTELIISAAEKNNGIILLSYGSVGIPTNYVPIVKDVSKVIPVVLSSQVPLIRSNDAGYEINVIAKEAGAIPGIGLYSFDYSNMANVLGIISETKREIYLERFRTLFENNQNRALTMEYHKTTNGFNIKKTTKPTVNGSPIDEISGKTRASMDLSLLELKRSNIVPTAITFPSKKSLRQKV